RQVNDEFHILANSWRYNQQFSSKLFFAFVDYDDSSDVFTMLDINSVPLIVHYPARGKPKKQDTFDLNKVAFSAEMMARWISERTDVAIRIFRPPSYS
ncbi:hypothetical protein HELRODRAFT_93081, partial [Helobdella robusta]|uniref:Uncharacterized protein n=1 Tax=Helobdella robusta TaxID=6412 RepID=T1G8S8_HELRO